MAFDPTTAQLVQASPSGFNPLTAKLVTSPIMEPVNEEYKPGYIPAVIGGLANTGANLLEGGVDAVAWIGEKLGAIKPSIAAQMKRDVAADMEKYIRSTPGSGKDDIFSRAAEANPMTTKGTEIASTLGAMGGMYAAPFKAAKVGGLASFAGNTAVQAPINAVIGAGMAGVMGQDQDQGALYNTVATPIVGALGTGLVSGAAKLESKLGLMKKLKDVIAPINASIKKSGLSLTDQAAESISSLATQARDIGNANWDAIKSIPGTINTKPILTKVNGLIQTKSKLLEPKQTAVLQDIVESAEALTNMDEAVKLKQMISSNSKLFKIGEVSDSLANEYKALRTQIDEAISSKAASAGKSNAWELANQYHKRVIAPLQDANAFEIAAAKLGRNDNPHEYAAAVQSLLSRGTRTPEQTKALLSMMDSDGSEIIQNHIVKNIFNDIVADPGAFSAPKALKALNKNIDKFTDVLSPQSIDVLKGIRKVMLQGGVRTDASVSNLGKALQSDRAAMGLGALAGSALGGVTGTAVGFIGAPLVLNGVKNLIKTPAGLAILRGIGQGRPWGKEIGHLLKTLPATESDQVSVDQP